MCASFGLEFTVVDFASRHPDSSTYLLQCAMQTTHLEGFEKFTKRLYRENMQHMSGKWHMIKTLLSLGSKSISTDDI